MPLRYVRLRAGMGPERDRVVHLTEQEPVPWSFAELPGSPSLAGVTRVLCGLMLIPGTYDVLSAIAGMPCESCAINCPGPEAGLPRQLMG